MPFILRSEEHKSHVVPFLLVGVRAHFHVGSAVNDMEMISKPLPVLVETSITVQSSPQLP